jgi:hypothetical protein
MWHDMTSLIEAVMFAVREKACRVLVLQRRVLPFPLRFEEQGEGIGTDVYAVCWRVLDTWDGGK